MLVSSKIKSKNNIIYLFYFLLAGLVISIIHYFFSSGFIYSFNSLGEIPYAPSPGLVLWLTFGFLIVISIANYFILNLSNGFNHAGTKLSLCLFYVYMLGVLLWSFFSFTLSLPVAGLIMLGLTICLGLYTCYRYLTRSIVGGVILTIFELYLMLVFSSQLAYLLLK